MRGRGGGGGAQVTDLLLSSFSKQLQRKVRARERLLKHTSKEKDVFQLLRSE